MDNDAHEDETTTGAGGDPDGAEAPLKGTNRVLKPGETFDHYRIISCLSTGFIANYYQAQHVQDLTDVTLAVLHPKTRRDPGLTRRLQALQKQTDAVKHAGIPRITAVLETVEQHCMVLEPVRGRTLSHVFENAQETSELTGLVPERVTDLLVGVLGTLGHAHAKGLNHLDLDTNAVVIDDNDGVILLGTGLKETLGKDLLESIISATVSPLASAPPPCRVNSLEILSPEFQRGESEDSRADLYAVGFISYWLLTGAKPDRNRFEPPTEFVEDLPRAWDHFVVRSIERQPDLRFSSAKVALTALKATEKEQNSARAGFIQRQIDRTPVPRGIASRGKLAARVFRLSVVGVIGLLLVALMAQFYTVIFEGPNMPDDPVFLATDAIAANLVIDTVPAAARVEFPATGHSFIVRDGRLELRVRKGTYQVRALSPGHRPKQIEVDLEEGGPATASIRLTPDLGGVDLTAPPGTEVTAVAADGARTTVGTTGADGRLTAPRALLSGTYTLVFSKSGYQPVEMPDQSVRFGETLTLGVELEAIPAGIRVLTDPPGAVVRVEGRTAGETPVDVADVPAGREFWVTVELPGYRTVGQQVKLATGEGAVVDFGALVPRQGTVTLDLDLGGAERTPELLAGFSVIIDGEPQAHVPGEPITVPEGPHRLEVRHPGFVPVAVELSIEDGEDEVVRTALRPRPGRLSVVLPRKHEYRLLVDGREARERDGVFEVPSGRPVDLELRVTDHLPLKRRMTFGPGGEASWSAQPVAIPGPAEGEGWTVPYRGIELAWIAPGTFLMGSPLTEPRRLPNEGPQTRVTFDYGYWAGVREVLQAEFESLMGANPSTFQNPRAPVHTITWEEAREFCRRLTERERTAGRLPGDYVYRLPTEAEWEFAARGGSDTPFSFGSEASDTDGNFKGTYPELPTEALSSSGHYGPVAAGSYPPNAVGLYDVHGNVREWTLDRYNGRLPGGRLNNPAPRAEGSRIATRGGGWGDNAVHSRSAERSPFSPSTRSDSIGFRIVLAPATAPE